MHKNIGRKVENLGAKIHWNSTNELTIDTRNIDTTEAPLDLTSKFRASYYLLGSLLSRKGSATVGMPGGCKLGARPIDQHIKGFEALGANVDIGQGKIIAKAKKLPGPAAGKAAPDRGEAAYSCGAVTSLRFCMGYGREGAGALRSRGRTSNAGFQA